MAIPLESRPGVPQPEALRMGLRDSVLRLVNKVINPHVSSRPPVDISTKRKESNGPNGNGEGLPTAELPQDLVERWRNLPARIQPYEGGTCNDGQTKYPPGKMLLIGQPDHEEEVMNLFEEKWIKASVREAWTRLPKTTTLDIAEAGFGMGIMSSEIHQKMIRTQRNQMGRGVEMPQRHVIIELNKQVFNDFAKPWARRMAVQAKRERRPIRLVFSDQEKPEEFIPEDTEGNILEIRVINGEADQELLKFLPTPSFNAIFADTHQLDIKYLGIHDMLRLEKKKLLLKTNGLLIPLAWHRDNKEGDLDSRQKRLLYKDFGRVEILNLDDDAEVIVRKDCEYLPGVSKIVLPIVICRYPRSARAA